MDIISTNGIRSIPFARLIFTFIIKDCPKYGEHLSNEKKQQLIPTACSEKKLNGLIRESFKYPFLAQRTKIGIKELMHFYYFQLKVPQYHKVSFRQMPCSNCKRIVQRGEFTLEDEETFPYICQACACITMKCTSEDKSQCYCNMQDDVVYYLKNGRNPNKKNRISSIINSTIIKSQKNVECLLTTAEKISNIDPRFGISCCATTNNFIVIGSDRFANVWFNDEHTVKTMPSNINYCTCSNDGNYIVFVRER